MHRDEERGGVARVRFCGEDVISGRKCQRKKLKGESNSKKLLVVRYMRGTFGLSGSCWYDSIEGYLQLTQIHY